MTNIKTAGRHRLSSVWQVTNEGNRMQWMWIAASVVLAVLLTVAITQASVIIIDPSQPPDVTLDPAEAQRLRTLQSAFYPPLLSDISPDDTTVLSASPEAPAGLAFLSLQDGATTPVTTTITSFRPLTEYRWRDADTLVFLAQDSEDKTVMVETIRGTGEVTATTTYTLPGFVISMAPNASRLLVAVPPSDTQTTLHAEKSIFDLELERTPFKPGVPAKMDFEEDLTMRFSSSAMQLVVLDTTTMTQTELIDLPPGSGLVDVDWSPDGTELALVRSKIPVIGREGNPLLDVATQDGLGHLSPDENPFVQNNVVDTFDLSAGTLRPAVLRATDNGDGDIFAGVDWSPDGETLLTRLQSPGEPSGRPYPTYINPNRSHLRFYTAAGDLLETLDRSETGDPFVSLPAFISPDEIIVTAVSGMNLGLYYYNISSDEFRQLPTADGTIYQARPTNQSREMVYLVTSLQQPPELFRIGVGDTQPTAVTEINTEVAAANDIRVDEVSFTLESGAVRNGYIIQPADAPFPPRDVRMVVWQQGGPTAPMTNDWGGVVEQPFNLLPSFGFAMLVVPLPGRLGLGPEFLDALADDRNFGQIDIGEQVEIVQQMIRRGYTSPWKVGLTGCSYGGYFTSQSITQYPDTYAAANMQCSLLDLHNEWQFGFTPYLSYLMGRTPFEDPAEYTKDSPVYNAERVETPVQIFAGTEDFLPYGISRNFHDIVSTAGTPAQFLVFKNEPHGLRQPTSQFVAGQAQINWFRQHLATTTSRVLLPLVSKN